MTGVLVGVAAFVAMEGVSYASHRWVMHGIGRAWHRSHHARPEGRLERNDLFPLCFSVVGFALFAVATLDLVPHLFAVAVGVTAYGVAYLFVHEIAIHRRIGWGAPRSRYVRWLRAAHADHHRGAGEPYGMLLPLVRSGRTDAAVDSDLLDRGPGRTPR